ncbi:MAG: O-methyltransferase [Lachnospiraceae bacterium]|nr:O-methyltransferase [Lachnospiraceae bacterium]
MKGLERIESFINSYIEDDEETLEDIYRQARMKGVPVIRRTTKELLKIMLMMKKPDSILEIGTAVGYSALFMSKITGDTADITTIELDDERAREAVSNIERLGKSKNIHVINADASEALKDLPDSSFDFIFVDAAKGQYINYYEDVIRLAKKEAVIVSDNILQDGEILESHFTVEKRNRTIHDRIREYLYLITHDNRVESSIVSVGDGVSVSIKK